MKKIGGDRSPRSPTFRWYAVLMVIVVLLVIVELMVMINSIDAHWQGFRLGETAGIVG